MELGIGKDVQLLGRLRSQRVMFDFEDLLRRFSLASTSRNVEK